MRKLLDSISYVALVSYRNPNNPSKPILPAGFDPAIERRFRDELASLQKREDYPKASSANFGDLRTLISAPHRAVHLGDYNFQALYEIR